MFRIKMYRKVELGKAINGKELEKVLVGAARKVGLKASSKDEFKIIYRLGSVHEEKEYRCTNVTFKKGIIPVAQVRINKDPKSIFYRGDSFDIMTGFYASPIAFAPKRLIERFLGAVSQLLENKVESAA